MILWIQTEVYRAGHLSPDCARGRRRCHVNHLGLQAVGFGALPQRRRYALFRKQARQFGLHRIADAIPVGGRKAVQYQFVNVNVHGW